MDSVEINAKDRKPRWYIGSLKALHYIFLFPHRADVLYHAEGVSLSHEDTRLLR